MHHFEKMSSASGSFVPRPPPGSCLWTLLGDFRPSDPLHCPPLGKILRVPMIIIIIIIVLVLIRSTAGWRSFLG